VITVIQRVRSARVVVDGETVGEIERGALLLVCAEPGDTTADAAETARKVAALRLLPGRTPLDRTLLEEGCACLVVSQFTLAGELRHGNRPDFTAAAPPTVAEPLYLAVADGLRAAGLPTATGRFGASMLVESCNEGPVTLILTVRGGKTVPRRTD
jgi:D-tyrosyl-tRNA(Tyr) deacylase